MSFRLDSMSRQLYKPMHHERIFHGPESTSASFLLERSLYLMNQSCDVAIIGAGTAGLSALREVRKKTDNFVIINDGPYGTTCARVGCMPSKALIESANTFHRREHFGELGIHGLYGDRKSVV